MRHVATETPAGVLVQYAEEVEGGGTRLRVAQSGRMIPSRQQTVYELYGLGGYSESVLKIQLLTRRNS